MAVSEVMAIERLGAGDIAAGLALSDAAGWNQTADDWAFFIAAADTFGVRDDAGRWIATAVALPYDDSVGWISMVLVDAAHRHRGIAGRLVDACVRSLRSRGRTPVLDATPAGATVYAKSGFVEGFAFGRWQGTSGAFSRSREKAGDEGLANAAPSQATPSPQPSPARGRGSLAAALAALDHAATGVDRNALWRAFLARPDTEARLAPDSDGFALARAGRRATQLGPVVASDEAAAIELVATMLAGVAGRVFIDVPARADALARWLDAHGFSRQRPFVRMALGDASRAAARPRVFAVAGPEFG